jgi:alkylhydroperoxidase/carboxymuconolactone decarboxylase family protein YurZ
MAETNFRDYLAAGGAQAGLTDREKTFIGLAVTMSRGCEPCSYGRIERGLESGVSREDLDAAVNLIAAINASVVQAIARRGHEHLDKTCPSCVVDPAEP